MTYESAVVIHRRKGGMIVPYLRARRRGNLPGKAHFRRLHFLYKRHGIACREPLW
ncbi:hypothetical protein [Oricola thermophila]|uniref:Uncharacterized protein n=1 Tax=Oricola thermophila TaxID=2742145 RepID=A0A6N1VMP4_9HYPH|nr:hypothetical protein [Oricola thermophila]QKV20257.1 hypothetical protein HTY61_18260 [Oricola thermophila]